MSTPRPTGLQAASGPLVLAVLGLVLMLATATIPVPSTGPPPPIPEATVTQASTAPSLPPGGLGALIGFEENLGQSAPEVRFLTKIPGGVMALTPSGFVLQGGSAGDGVRLSFTDANPGIELTGEEPLPGRINYFHGAERGAWVTEVPHFERIHYEELYPGTDLVVYRNAAGQVEFDLVLAPGADPTAPSIQVRGAQGLEVAGDGSLQVATSGPVLVLQAPTVFQVRDGDRLPVEAAYALQDDGTVAFVLGPHDDDLSLIIDPVITYATYLGGTGDEGAVTFARDDQGRTYLAGLTTSTDFPAGQGAFQEHRNGEDCLSGWCPDWGIRNTADAFVARLNPEGDALDFATYYGGSLGDTVRGVDLDSTGNIYISGQTESDDLPVTPGAFDTSLNGVAIFVAKFDPTGSDLLYGTFLHGNMRDEGWGRKGLAVTPGGHAVVTGETFSTDFPTKNAFQATKPGSGQTTFVTMFSPDGSDLVYSTYLGGSGGGGGWQVDADDVGNVYVAGYTSSPDFPVTPGAFQTTIGGGGSVDGYVVKFDPQGTPVVGTFLGGSGHDQARAIEVDGIGGVHVAGITTSSNMPTTPDAFQSQLPGINNAFMISLTPDMSSLNYGTYFGGSQVDLAFDVAVDAAGNRYITGVTNSDDMPLRRPLQSELRGPSDAFLAKFAIDGSIAYSTYLGGERTDAQSGAVVHTDALGVVSVAWSTRGTEFQGRDAYQVASAGDSEVYLARIVDEVEATGQAGAGTGSHHQPSEPLNLHGSRHGSVVVLSWDAPTFGGDTPVVAYTVFQAEGPVNGEPLVTVPSVQTTVVVDVPEDAGALGETLYYRVAAINSAEEGVWSEAAACPPFPLIGSTCS